MARMLCYTEDEEGSHELLNSLGGEKEQGVEDVTKD